MDVLEGLNGLHQGAGLCAGHLTIVVATQQGQAYNPPLKMGVLNTEAKAPLDDTRIAPLDWGRWRAVWGREGGKGGRCLAITPASFPLTSSAAQVANATRPRLLTRSISLMAPVDFGQTCALN